MPKIKFLDIDNVSHIISFKRLGPQNIIRVGDELRPGTAEVWTDSTNQLAAAVDIFLDIAMFNSIPYFRDKLSIEEKQDFNSIKLAFFNKNNFNSYFVIDKNAPPSYISFAFAFRQGVHKIDYSGYVDCWDEFIESDLITQKFGEIKIKMESPEIQIKQHKNFNQLPQMYSSNKYWQKFQQGDYLLLRVHSLPNTAERARKIKRFFGIVECQVGPVKIVPISDYFRPDIKRDINEGNISAFKVVV